MTWSSTGAPAQASIVSLYVAPVRTTLGVAVTSSVSTPLFAGQSATIPVTVSAGGDRVVSGQVTAEAPSGWTVTPARFSRDTRNGPVDTVVDVTVTAPAGSSGGRCRSPWWPPRAAHRRRGPRPRCCG